MRFNTLDAWLQWQERLHPTGIDLGLDRVGGVWRRLRPEGLTGLVVTVGGTNGKGSCVALLDAMLRAAGYRTGSYTSPHLLHYNERICIEGTPVPDGSLCQAFERVDLARRDQSLTYFEFGTLAALDLFAGARLDVLILEVGLGGRLDAVNLVDGDVALVTNIGLDHTAWLGPDLDSIAGEKAGIFRPGRPAVVGQTAPPVGLLQAAGALGAKVLQAGRDFRWERHGSAWSWIGPARRRHGLPMPVLRSGCQLDNAAAVLMVLDALDDRLPVDQSAVRTGLQQARLPGRLQVLPGEVTLILDVAHNTPAAVNLANDLRAFPPGGQSHVVFGCLQDKDAEGMMEALGPVADTWYLASPGGQRAFSPEALRVAAHRAAISVPVHTCATVAEAFGVAMEAATPGDRLLVTGSFLTVAAVLAIPTVSGRAGLV